MDDSERQGVGEARRKERSSNERHQLGKAIKEVIGSEGSSECESERSVDVLFARDRIWVETESKSTATRREMGNQQSLRLVFGRRDVMIEEPKETAAGQSRATAEEEPRRKEEDPEEEDPGLLSTESDASGHVTHRESLATSRETPVR
ncbi:hypothetical protein KM043_006531 [Ampulex compressa]|nr:hypothetical protein KM043_006531 [Ampulex compressa]